MRPVQFGPTSAGVHSTHGCGDFGGITGVPKTGEVNQKFGVYKSTCCGYEIVITIWKLLPDEDMTDVTGKKRSASKRAA